MYLYMLTPQNFRGYLKNVTLKNVVSDRANIVTAEIGTPDNLTDQVWRKSGRGGCTSEEKIVNLSWNAP